MLDHDHEGQRREDKKKKKRWSGKNKHGMGCVKHG